MRLNICYAHLVKFPVHEVSLMLSIALRFVPTLMDETEKIMNVPVVLILVKETYFKNESYCSTFNSAFRK